MCFQSGTPTGRVVFGRQKIAIPSMLAFAARIISCGIVVLNRKARRETSNFQENVFTLKTLCQWCRSLGEIPTTRVASFVLFVAARHDLVKLRKPSKLRKKSKSDLCLGSTFATSGQRQRKISRKVTCNLVSYLRDDVRFSKSFFFQNPQIAQDLC